MRLLVTGGAGYVGSHTVRLLAEHGHEVTVVDNLSTGHREAVGRVPLVVADLAETGLIRDLLRDRRIEAVLHFAAFKSVEESMRKPERYFRNNVCGSLSLVEAARAARVGLLVNSSTCAVYGEPARPPISESAVPEPANPYGESKLAVERMLASLDRAGHLRHVTLRYFNAAGAWPDGSLGEDWTGAQNLVPAAMRAALTGSTLRVFGADYATPDGTAVRDYVHVLDLAEAHLAALEHLARGGESCVLNVGSGRPASVRQVVLAVEAASGRGIRTEVAPRRAGDVAAIWADTSRAAAVLSWAAKRGLAEIAQSAWRWHSGHPSGFADTPGV